MKDKTGHKCDESSELSVMEAQGGKSFKEDVLLEHLYPRAQSDEHKAAGPLWRQMWMIG